jgi:hypothetical protein
MKKLITKDTIKKVLEQYSKYKLSLSERGIMDSISSEIADELRRNFIIEPINRKHGKQYSE